MIDHARADDLSAAAIDFDLTPLDRDELSTHLSACPACGRVADAYRRDAETLRAIAFAEPPAHIRDSVLASAARPVPRAVIQWRLVAATALLLLALMGAVLAVGALQSRPFLVVITTTPAPTIPAPSPTTVLPSAAVISFAPPAPACPAPATAVSLPDVQVSVGDAGGVIATRGSSAATTCSTTATEVIYDHVGSLALGGLRIAWVRADSTVDSIWTSTRGATEPIEIAAPADGRLFLLAMDRLAVTDDLVAWVETAEVLTEPGEGACCDTLLAVWAPDAPGARYIEGFGATQRMGISGGWLTVLTSPNPLIGLGRPAGFHAVPVADVRP